MLIFSIFLFLAVFIAILHIFGAFGKITFFGIADICFRTNYFLVIGTSIFAVAARLEVFLIIRVFNVHLAQLLSITITGPAFLKNHYYQFICSYANWNQCPTNISSDIYHTHKHILQLPALNHLEWM